MGATMIIEVFDEDTIMGVKKGFQLGQCALPFPALHGTEEHRIDLTWKSESRYESLVSPNKLMVLSVEVDWKSPFDDDMQLGAQLKAREAYALAFDAYQGAAEDEHAHVVPLSHSMAGSLLYQFWPAHRIVTTLVLREHIVPKMFTRLPAITRVERYCVLSSAINTAFFWQTFLFNESCLMVPQPSVCKPPAAEYMKFVPSVATFVATLFGLFASVPVPLFLMTCFRKAPIQETLTESEKRFQRWVWRCKAAVGWTFVFGWNAYIIFWLTLFSNHYSWQVFEKWMSSAGQALFHRFVSAPVGRAFAFALLAIMTRHTGFLDCCVVLWPHIVPTELLKKPRKGSESEPESEDITID